jgi:Hydroxypyruvate isomerase
MLKFSANLTFLYSDKPLLERIACAGRAGFKAVEFMSPYEEKPEDIKKALDENAVLMALFNTRAGKPGMGERGYLAIAHGGDSVFADALADVIRYATHLSCPRINVQAGIAPEGEAPAMTMDRVVERLRHAADLFAGHGINALLEHCNRHDIPGYFIDTPDKAVEALRRVDRPNAKLQYDFYHAQRTSGELVAFFRDHADMIDHIQIADNPGRNQPGTGEINYTFVLSELERLGYQGWIGLEYKPLPDADASYGWMKEMGYAL